MGNENPGQETNLHDMEKTVITYGKEFELYWSWHYKYTKQNMTELQLQAKCCQWYWNEFRFTSAKLCLHTNMNNSFNRIEGARNKSLGVIPGVSDCEFIDFGCVWFIEFKTIVGKQSQEQIEFQKMIEERGMKYVIIFSFEEFSSFIRKRISLWNTGK